MFRTKSLLQERQQDGNDNATFKTFSEANEEDCARISMLSSTCKSSIDILGTAKTLTPMAAVVSSKKSGSDRYDQD
jgi:hypothetical protein